MLLCAAASGRREQDNQVLRYALLSLAALTLVLNLYALAAIAYRTLELGLTPNRHAVLGWNIVTLEESEQFDPFAHGLFAHSSTSMSQLPV